MSRGDGVNVEGLEELRRLLRKMPDAAAVNLVRAEKRNLIDHLDEAMRSSRFEAGAARRVRRSFVIYPRGRVTPRRIEDVRAGSFTTWKGAGVEDAQDPQAAARVLERSVGRSTVTPTSGDLLAIPAGRLRTPSGQVRRRGRKRATVRDARKFVRGRGSTFVLEDGDRRLVFFRQAATSASGRRRRRRGGRQLARKRQSLVGVLVPQARVEPRLDYFGAWDRLEGRRRERYGRLLRDVIAGRIRR